MRNKFPVYIISKGRFNVTMTANLFEADNLDYLIAVEPQEYDSYVNKLGKDRVLKLPFSNLGLGSYPARNFCWEHSMRLGYTHHWLFDDNIKSFYKWINAKRCQIKDIKTSLSYIESYILKNNIDFIIGGAFGLDQSILNLANIKLCLSKMTMPHQMAKLILLEQIYRAQTILDGHPYHK